MGVVDGHRRGPVLELRVLGRDERDPPLAVHHHRELSHLERVRCRKLVSEACLEAHELVVPVPVDEALLPAQELRPREPVGEDRLALAVEVLASVERRVVRHVGEVARVHAPERVEAGDCDLPAAPLRQLLRGGRQLADRLRRALDPCLREERLVVVEPVRVGEERQRTPLALVLGVVERGLRELAEVDVVLLQVGAEVDPGACAAVDPHVRRGERADHVGRVPGSDRVRDLRVVDRADDLHVHVRVLRVVLGHDALELLQLACAPAHPDRDRHPFLRRLRAGALGGLRRGCDRRRAEHQDGEQDSRPTSHRALPEVEGVRGS